MLLVDRCSNSRERYLLMFSDTRYTMIRMCVSIGYTTSVTPFYPTHGRWSGGRWRRRTTKATTSSPIRTSTKFGYLHFSTVICDTTKHDVTLDLTLKPVRMTDLKFNRKRTVQRRKELFGRRPCINYVNTFNYRISSTLS